MEHAILKTVNLSVGYYSKKESLTILQDINIELMPNTFYALIGKNGIGKSTLIRTLAGLQNSLSGELIINKKALDKFNKRALAKQLSIVTTDTIPASNFTVYELVALGRQPYNNWLGKLNKQDKSIIKKALLSTEINELSHRKLATLSDGQLQKVMIARALAQDTAIILLDEPTTHLDLENKTAILLLLKKLSKKKTILISTHEINSIIPLADELLIASKTTIFKGNLTKKTIENELKSLFSDKILNFDTKTQQFYVKK
jgi:iron complex transport system ATP-binding protein